MTKTIKLIAFLAIGFTAFFYFQKFDFRKDNLSTANRDHGFKLQAYQHFDGPAKFARIEHYIRTRDDLSYPEYEAGYTYKEFQKAANSVQFRTGPIAWVERGPYNVGGRTRGLAFDPSDSEHHSWYAGSVGGGVWKTEDAGDSWTNLTPDLPNLATSTIAVSPHNPNIIYVGTGEGFDGLMINGSGIWKSEDKGQNWTVLSPTAGNKKFGNVLRIIVNPNNENELVVSTVTSKLDYTNGEQSFIFKSTDGGLTWDEKHVTQYAPIQQIVFTPGNFNVQYATVNSVGILKSTDAGDTWTQVFDAAQDGIARMEMSVSPKDPGTIFVACEKGEESILYVSRDSLTTANRVLFNTTSQPQWLGGQGWYDNAIAAHPFDKNKVWVAGSGSILQLEIGTNNQAVTQLTSVENTTTFLEEVPNSDIPALPFGLAETLLNQLFLDPQTTEDDLINVEVRFGPNIHQKAHLLTFNPNTFQISYGDFIDVPFQAWDTENNKQLVLSFVDVNEDGKWTFAEATSDNSQDLVLINILDYDTIANPIISGNNNVYKAQYQFNLQKVASYSGDETTFPNAHLKYNVGTVQGLEADFTDIADGYYEFSGDSKGVHVDHHNLTLLPIDEATGQFYVLNGNDGGVAFSSDSGQTFRQTGDAFNQGGNYPTSDGYIVSQFYGVDKMNGADRYVGGTQDNGSWVSPVNWTTEGKWASAPSGDGFEAAWNYADTNQVLESSQYNNIYKSTDGGVSWQSVYLPESNGPFITRIASSQLDPNLVFVSSDEGLIKSTDFGDSWEILQMPDSWEFTFFGPPIAIGLSDANVVWSGSKISSNSRIAVSKDKGATWTETANYTQMTMGRVTGLATHPTNPATAYALFSQANGPKILKTSDWGSTWTDISGFVTQTDTSSNGFPDVATQCLLVMPFDTNRIWVGTEIGLFESLDGGESWAYANNGLPAVSIWAMRIVNDQIVLATHGRGIWTVNTSELTGPDLTHTETIPENHLLISPNPVSDHAEITFINPSGKKVQVTLFSENGRLIKPLFKGSAQGTQKIAFDKADLPAGIYFVNMKTQEGLITKKMIIQ